MHGEHELPSSNAVNKTGSPPHTRGTRDFSLTIFDDGGITPAYTGNTMIKRLINVEDEDHPRIHGEHFPFHFRSPFQLGSPPHTRGTPITVFTTRQQSKDHPRIHGEHLSFMDWLPRVVGSPPHTRGTRSCFFMRFCILGITPAYTGNTSR